MNAPEKRKSAWRSIWLNLHIYLGLLCAPYLIIFGVSSLNFNHHFAPSAPAQEVITWSHVMENAPAGTNDQQIADVARDALGMLGWAPWWELKPQTDGNLRFAVENPGRSYKVLVDKSKNELSVQESRKGFLQVVNSLHGLTELPNSTLAPAWGVYTNICAFSVIFISISGIYLWAGSKRERRSGLVVVLLSIAVSVGFMLLVVLRG